LDPEQGLEKIRITDWKKSGSRIGKKSGSRMNIPDHISESLETIFWVKTTKILRRGSGSGIF
jgi:hypothetical protein